MDVKLQPCDIILTHGKDFFGDIILFILRVCQKDPVKYHHVIFVVEDTTVVQPNWKIEYSNLEDALNDYKYYKVIRCRDLTDEDKEKMLNAADKLCGSTYSILRLLLQIPDQIFSTDFFTRLFKDKKSQVCSSFVAWIFYVVKRIKFNNVGWESCDPDDIDDESLLNSDDWIIVAEK